MNDKRIYPNTVVFKGTDDNEITYINERVIEQIRAEISEYKDDKIIHAERNEMIDIVLEIIDKYTK